MTQTADIDDFLHGHLDPARFDHAAHIGIARTLLDQYEFLEAARLYMQGLAGITRKAGDPEKVSLTKTLAFLSLIADGQSPDRQALGAFYSPERLADPRGRSIFLMPDRTKLEADGLR